MTARTLCFLLLSPLLATGCGSDKVESTPGDPQHGRAAIREYGCGSCHVIPGISGADGHTGPSLERIAKRVYLAGVLPNTPDDMARWIREPEVVDPRTAMPNMGVSESDARDITAYLYTLK